MVPWLLTNIYLLNTSTQKSEHIWPLVFELQKFIWLSFHQTVWKAEFWLPWPPWSYSYACVMLHGKWDFADVIKVTDQLTLKCYPGGPMYSHKPWKAEKLFWLTAAGKSEIQSMRRTWCAIVGLKLKGDLSPTIAKNWILPTTWIAGPPDKNPAQLTPWFWPSKALSRGLGRVMQVWTSGPWMVKTVHGCGLSH